MGMWKCRIGLAAPETYCFSHALAFELGLNCPCENALRVVVATELPRIESISSPILAVEILMSMLKLVLDGAKKEQRKRV